jgi:hypothetical protein
MSTKIDFVEVPESLITIIGEPVPETRLYRIEGPEEGAEAWYEALANHFEGLVSPGGAGMFAPVGRAAVHKRLKEGNLTGFAYHVTEPRKKFFSRLLRKREKPYMFILVSELKQWAKEIEEQALRLGKVTREELEGTEPDYDGDFLYKDSKWEREKKKKSKGQRGG